MSAPAVPGRSLWPFAVLSASYFAHVGFFNPYLPLWLKDQGYGLLFISLMTALPSATRLFAPYLWAWLSDRTGHRVAWLRYCATVAFAVSLMLGWTWGALGLFVVLLFMFTHTSGMMPLSESLLAQSVSRAGQFDARRYGRIRLWGSMGFMVTVMVAGWWFGLHGMNSFPYWTVGSLAAVVASVWWMPETRDPPHPSGSHPAVGPVLRRPVVRWFFLAVFLHLLAHTFVYVFFSLYLDELGYSKLTIGALWAVAVVAEIAWFYTQGVWTGRISVAGWMVLAGALTVVRMGLTAGGGTWLWALVVAQVLHAITFAAHHSACIAWIHQHFPDRLRARGQALYATLGYGLAGVVAGTVGGWISSRWGLGSVFWLAAVAAAAAWGAAWAMRHGDQAAAAG